MPPPDDRETHGLQYSSGKEMVLPSREMAAISTSSDLRPSRPWTGFGFALQDVNDVFVMRG